MKYNKEADAYLKKLYDSVGATTPEHQYNTLNLKLGILPEGMTFHMRQLVNKKF